VLIGIVLLCAALVLSACTSASAPPQRAAETSPTTTAPRPRVSVEPTVAPLTPPTTFAVIGDYGTNDKHERAVARLVASWDPAYVVATGDDYYSQAGGKGLGKYRASTGRYYGAWIPGAADTTAGAETNAFFPAMGNHDYADATPSPKTYLRYFDLPGEGFASTSDNERYYDFVNGPVHFFVLNSNPQEPDGTRRTSKQARWLKTRLASSDSAFNVVVDHHPPYSSDVSHGSTRFMQWPFAEWGADVVLSGHAHTYERIERDGIVYFVNGLGGAKRYRFGKPVKGSRKRFAKDWGAQKVTVAEDALDFEFYDVDGELVDRYRVEATQ